MGVFYSFHLNSCSKNFGLIISSRLVSLGKAFPSSLACGNYNRRNFVYAVMITGFTNLKMMLWTTVLLKLLSIIMVLQN